MQPTFPTSTVTALSDLHVWLGLKNSDDQGTQFDLKADVFKNGTLVSSGLTRCITGIVRNANTAKEATVTFGSFSPVTFNGSTENLSIKMGLRIQLRVRNGFARPMEIGDGEMLRIEFGVQPEKRLAEHTAVHIGMSSGPKVDATLMSLLGEGFAGDHYEEYRSD